MSRSLLARLRSLHQRIAQVLENTPTVGSEHVYAVAHHYGRAQVACLLRNDDAGLVVAAVSGQIDRTAVGEKLDPAADRTLTMMVDAAVAMRGTATSARPAPLPEVLTGVRSWIAVPLASPAKVVGLLMVLSATPDAYTYENACLFDQVRQLAARADAALYQAMRRGCDRVFSAATPTHTAP